MTTLYEAIGGAGAVTAAADEFYRRLLADSTVAPYFAGMGADERKRHQRAFISMALNGSQRCHIARSARRLQGGPQARLTNLTGL